MRCISHIVTFHYIVIVSVAMRRYAYPTSQTPVLAVLAGSLTNGKVQVQPRQERTRVP
jgi:hypothetical protein